jgi:site-specific recombinase XerD
MATIKLAILKHTQAKDGSYKIRIAIGHKQETHYIITRYKVLTWANFRNGVVCNQPDANYINVKLRNLLNDYDTRLDSIPNLSDLTCGQLRDMLRDMRAVTSSATILGVANEYTTLLRKENRSSYAKIIDTMVRKFLEYTNGDIYLQNISTATIDGYSHYLKAKGFAPAYETMCLVNIRTLVNRAIKLQLVRYDVHPFLYWHATQAEPRELDISVEDMRKFLTYQGKAKGKQRSVDFFLLSYYLGGINLIDLVAYDFRNYKQQGILRYIRRKTRIKKRSNQYVEFSIPAEAYPIIDKYMNPKTGHILDVTEKQYRNRLNIIDTNLRNIAADLGITRKVSFYTARKSFVQHGFELGIPLETLEYCIGQSMKANRPIFNYVRIMKQHADLAIRQILEQLYQKEDASAPSNE